MATMEVQDVQKLVKGLSVEAAQRQGTLKKWIIGLCIFIGTMTLVFSLMFIQQGNDINDLQASNIALQKSNAKLATVAEDLSDTVNRRSPILDHMFCRDKIEDERGFAKAERDRVQTLFIFKLLEAGDETTPEETVSITEAGEAYLAAENSYIGLWAPETTICPPPELPKG